MSDDIKIAQAPDVKVFQQILNALGRDSRPLIVVITIGQVYIGSHNMGEELGGDPPSKLTKYNSARVRSVLYKNNWNFQAAADEMGTSRHYLYRLAKKYGIGGATVTDKNDEVEKEELT